MPESANQPAGPNVDSDQPWLGLHPFTEENRAYFFGRTAEIRDIFERVRQNPLTVLYGQSGFGKTSLLRAGLLPKLRDEGFRPTHILLDFSRDAPPLITQVRRKLAAVLAADGDTDSLLAHWKPLGSLWQIFAHEQLRPSGLEERPPVLIFDQFEEVFTLGGDEATPGFESQRRDEVRELFIQLADLIENRPPEALQQLFRVDRRLARDYVLGPISARVIFTIREDYLSQLEDWKGHLPSLMRNRMPLRLLSGPQALEAVVKPGRLDGRSLVSDEVGAQIVRFAAKRHPETRLEEIEAVPPLVSLLCERLNEARRTAGFSEITADLVREQGADILQRFYDESFTQLLEGVREPVREFVEREGRLVTASGHRNPVAREDARAELENAGVANPDSVLDALVNRRLLTVEHRGGTQRLEITHDVLCPLVVRARNARKNRIAAEEAERRKLEAEREAAVERKRRNQFLFALTGMTVLFLLALAALVFAVKQTQRANKETQRAEDALKQVQHQLARAQTEEGRAWLERSKLQINRGNAFAGTIMAGRALGFTGFGREKIADKKFLQNYPSLLTDVSTPQDEGDARSLIGEAAYQAYSGMLLWQSPIVQQHGGYVSSVSWSPDGKTLASGSEDKTVKLWEAATGKLLATFEGHTDPVYSVSWSPDGKTLASGSGDTVKLWEAATGKLLATFKDSVSSVSWSPDGKTLASGSGDKTVKLWEAATGKLLATFEGHTDYVSSVSWSPDGKTLASGSWDKTVKLWEAETDLRLDLAEYLSGGWVELQGNELAWHVNDNITRDRAFPVINTRPDTLIGLRAAEGRNADARGEDLVMLLRADNFPSAVSVWSVRDRETPKDAALRKVFLAAACARATDDLKNDRRWRGLWLISQLTPELTSEALGDPAVSLGALELATVLATSNSADTKLVTTRDALLQRLRAVAPRTWHEALAVRMKALSKPEGSSSP
jgi:hypothetical protein